MLQTYTIQDAHTLSDKVQIEREAETDTVTVIAIEDDMHACVVLTPADAYRLATVLVLFSGVTP